MATFLPIRTPNAIDQAVFVVKLSQKIGETQLAELKQLENILSDEFPHFSEVKLQGVMMGADGGTTSLNNRVIGIECRSGVTQQEHMLNGERSDWVLRVSEDSIQINCLNYTDWSSVASYVCSLLDKVFGCISSDNLMIVGVNFQVNDAFVVKDTIDDIDYTQLFNHSKYLTGNAWNIGLLWHVNSGWFVEDTEYERVLQVLNISTRTDETQSVKLIVLIEHMQQYTMSSVIPVESKNELLQKVFGELHSNNKELMKELVVPNIKENIGLT